MAEVDTSSYPRPQPQQNPMDMITKVGQLQSTLGDLEVGKGVQQALGPDGQIDRNRLASFLGQTVAGSSKAIPTLDALERLRGAGFGADAAGLDTLQKRFALTSHLFGPIADKGDKATMADVHKVAAAAMSMPGAKELGIDLPMVMNIVKRFHGTNGKPMTSREIAKTALDLTTQAGSSSEVLGQHSPQYGVIDDGQTKQFVPLGTKQAPQLPNAIPNMLPPGTTLPGKDNQPQFMGNTGSPPVTYPQSPPVQQTMEKVTGSQPGPILNPVTGAPSSFKNRFEASGVSIPPPQQPRGPMAAPEPGFSTATEGEANNSTRMAAELQTAANEAPATKAIIGNLENEVKNFTSGPLADYKRIGKSFAVANLPIPDTLKKEGAMFDPKSIADQESFNKNIFNLVQSQFKALGGTGTDAKLDSASHTSPSELMSTVGIKNILGLLKGNQDAIEAKTKAWNEWRKTHGPQTYPAFAEDFNSKFDPRAFQFKYMKPKDRQEYFDKIDNDVEKVELLRRIKVAKESNWVKY